MNLVLEEAQNYIRENKKAEEDSISKQVFERLAREGAGKPAGIPVTCRANSAGEAGTGRPLPTSH